MRLETLTAKALQIEGLDRYQLAIAVAKRADELLDGAQSKLNIDLKTIKAADLALMEIAEGVISVKGFVKE